MKSFCSPLGLLFRASHEQLNPWHRVSGRIIYVLLFNHAAWYLNYFVQAGVLYQRLTAGVVIIGLFAFLSLTVVVSSSLEMVRRWSYRMFFVLHFFIGLTVLPLLFFHVRQIRVYVIEAFALFIVDLVARKVDTVTGLAKIARVPHTRLLVLKVLIPSSKIARFRAAAGQHVYLSIPRDSVPAGRFAPSIHYLLFNPFTVADVSDTYITLVIRHLRGPTTKALDDLVSLSKAAPPINIEGPLGASRRFPPLAESFDRVLLVAGGVGATFLVPIYQHLRKQVESESKSADRVKFAWSMRSAAEVRWVANLNDGLSLEDINTFVTGRLSEVQRHVDETVPPDGSVELDDLDWADAHLPVRTNLHRPKLGRIVDETFGHGPEESVAVLVCGPTGMARELRKEVSKWAKKGRYVWWHDESFGW